MRSNVAIKKRRAGRWGHKIGRAWFLSWPVNLGIHQFALYKDLEGSHSLWHTSFVPSKQSANLEELSQKYDFSLRYLKRHWAYSTVRTLPRKIRKKRTAGSRSGTSSKRYFGARQVGNKRDNKRNNIFQLHNATMLLDKSQKNVASISGHVLCMTCAICFLSKCYTVLVT